MFFGELLVVIAIALLFTFLLVVIFGTVWRSDSGGAAPFVWLFVILLFAIWAGGAWVGPAGPLILGVAWLPFLIVGFVVALLLAAAAESGSRRRGRPVSAEAGDESALQAFGVASLVLLIILVAAIAAAYLR